MNSSHLSDSATQDPVSPSVRISILHVSDCPLVARLRAEVGTALEHAGASAVIEEFEGEYRSPTLLIDGVEIDGYPAGADPACRTELPSQDLIVAAIVAATTKRQRPTGGGLR